MEWSHKKDLVLICRSCKFDSRTQPMPRAFGEIELRPENDVYVPICPLCGADASLFTRDQALVDDLIYEVSQG